MTHDEENKVLAEWLGWKIYKSRDGRFYEAVPPEQLHYIVEAGATHSTVAACSKAIPDFRASEEANAMLLEKMPEPILSRGVSRGLKSEWICQFNAADVRRMVSVEAADRKSAIVEAALKAREMELGK